MWGTNGNVLHWIGLMDLSHFGGFLHLTRKILSFHDGGYFISDEDIICVMLYNCSISKDETIDLDQKQEAQRILADNPNYSIR